MVDGIGAILHTNWRRGIKKGEITGYWAEDLNPYTIIAPEQLVDIIIKTQNWLSIKYREAENLQSQAKNILQWFE